MSDLMMFPHKWEQFLHDYEFEDARRIYTNGARLIPSFRVKQMVEHYFKGADVMEVVRCGECRHMVSYKVFDREVVWCERLRDEFDSSRAIAVDLNDFCSYGERRGEAKCTE